MNIVLVTIQVVGNPLYDSVTERWIKTYKEFAPTIKHDVLLVTCDSDKTDAKYDSVATKHVRYYGGGWDCGTWLHIGKMYSDDTFLICCNTSTYFVRHGWMERFVLMAETHGVGLYGSMASYEYHPHIRTPCMAFHPSVTWKYPHVINNREKTYFFECLGASQNFSQWCIAN